MCLTNARNCTNAISLYYHYTLSVITLQSSDIYGITWDVEKGLFHQVDSSKFCSDWMQRQTGCFVVWSRSACRNRRFILSKLVPDLVLPVGFGRCQTDSCSERRTTFTNETVRDAFKNGTIQSSLRLKGHVTNDHHRVRFYRSLFASPLTIPRFKADLIQGIFRNLPVCRDPLADV